MIKLNVNEEKQLTFEFKIEGVNADQVTSYLRLEIDKVEYGFPATIGKETITVDLPALRNITNGRLKEGVEAEIRLDVIADGTYLTPWKDTCKLSNPLTVEAKIVGNSFSSSPVVTPKITKTGKVGDKKQGVVVEKVETQEKTSLNEDEIVNKILSKLAGKLPTLVSEQRSQITPKKTKPTQKNSVTPNVVKNITKEGVYEYMHRAGTKSEHIQNIIYEQAQVAAKSDKPVEVLKQVVKILKRK